MHYQYGSLKSSTTRRHQVAAGPQCSWKKLSFILLPIILFAVLVGHIVTIAFIGSTTRHHRDEKNHHQSLYSKSQATSEKHFKEYLSKPCLLSEKFHNPIDQGKTPIRTKEIDNDTGNGHNSSPPMPPPDGCTSVILIFRHCEGGNAREHCGYMGNLRSQYLATLFGTKKKDRWPEPSYIFAMTPGERHNDAVNNWREIETVTPLSEKVKVTIDTSFGFPEQKKFVKHLYKMLREGKMCGKVSVISWKHHDIPDLSHSLGCGPENGCPDTFGEYDYEAVWELTYSYNKEKYAPYVLNDTSRHGLKKRHPYGLYPEWSVYGSLQHEEFDYLKFTKSNGSF